MDTNAFLSVINGLTQGIARGLEQRRASELEQAKLGMLTKEQAFKEKQYGEESALKKEQLGLESKKQEDEAAYKKVSLGIQAERTKAYSRYMGQTGAKTSGGDKQAMAALKQRNIVQKEQAEIDKEILITQARMDKATDPIRKTDLTKKLDLLKQNSQSRQATINKLNSYIPTDIDGALAPTEAARPTKLLEAPSEELEGEMPIPEIVQPTPVEPTAGEGARQAALSYIEGPKREAARFQKDRDQAAKLEQITAEKTPPRLDERLRRAIVPEARATEAQRIESRVSDAILNSKSFDEATKTAELAVSQGMDKKKIFEFLKQRKLKGT